MGEWVGNCGWGGQYGWGGHVQGNWILKLVLF